MSLRSNGYEVLAAEDGEKALRIFLEEPSDLAILDIMMPKLRIGRFAGNPQAF